MFGTDEKARAWRPNEDELQTALALVQSLAPRNEAEAALAAQAVAIGITNPANWPSRWQARPASLDDEPRPGPYRC